MNSCNEVNWETLSDCSDGALSLLQSWRVRRHLATCPTCAKEYAVLERLKTAAQGYHSDADIPATLRVRVRAALPPKRRPATGAIRIGIVGAVLVTGLLFAVAPRRNAVTGVAFAEVEQATARIRTARWTEYTSSFNTVRNPPETGQAVVTQYARLDPPALRTEFPEGYVCIDTSDQTVQFRPDRQHPGKLVWMRGKKDVGMAAKDLEAAFRQEILGKILHKPAREARRPEPPIKWRAYPETLDGRPVIRFHIGIGAGNTDAEVERLTRPGYQQVLWADPTTYRVVRSLQEYYDGKRHSRTIGENYEYDLQLPASLFDTTPPKDTRK